MIVVAAFEAPAVVAGLDDVAVVGQAVEKSGGHLGVAEHAGPFTERQIGGDDDRRSLVEPADKVAMDTELAQLQRNITRIRREIQIQSQKIQTLIEADIDCTNAAHLLMRKQATLVLFIEKQERRNPNVSG